MNIHRSMLATASILLGLMTADTLAGAKRFMIESGQNRPIDSTTPESALIALLNSGDGITRAKATAEVFRRGESILPALERAGAKPIATLAPSRLNVVYSLLKGELPGNYRPDSFGLHLGDAVSREAVIRMGNKHGFFLQATEPVRPGSSPACYVVLAPGKSLAKILRSLLQEEPNVITVNLNYTES